MPRMENLVALAKLLDVDLLELFEYVPGMARSEDQMRVLLMMADMSREAQKRFADGLEAAREHFALDGARATSPPRPPLIPKS